MSKLTTDSLRLLAKQVKEVLETWKHDGTASRLPEVTWLGGVVEYFLTIAFTASQDSDKDGVQTGEPDNMAVTYLYNFSYTIGVQRYPQSTGEIDIVATDAAAAWAIFAKNIGRMELAGRIYDVNMENMGVVH